MKVTLTVVILACLLCLAGGAWYLNRKPETKAVSGEHCEKCKLKDAIEANLWHGLEKAAVSEPARAVEFATALKVYREARLVKKGGEK